MKNTSRRLLFAALALLLLFAGVAAGVLVYKRSHAAPKKGEYYSVGEHWTEALGPADTASAAAFGDKLLALQSSLLTENNRVFCAIIPDKGYYLHTGKTAPTDYAALYNAAEAQLQGSSIEMIDLKSALSLTDYYTTDSHWRQERLQPVVDALGHSMDFSISLADFERQGGDVFIGAYGKGGAAAPESLYYLINNVTAAALADNFQFPEVQNVYDLPRLTGEVAYDVFLSGATPLVSIESPRSNSERELVVFRDSYASSLVPLLLNEYRRITLVDIRYMVSGLVPEYVSFTNQDVLFLYSTFVVNQSSMLR